MIDSLHSSPQTQVPFTRLAFVFGIALFLNTEIANAQSNNLRDEPLQKSQPVAPVAKRLTRPTTVTGARQTEQIPLAHVDASTNSSNQLRDRSQFSELVAEEFIAAEFDTFRQVEALESRIRELIQFNEQQRTIVSSPQPIEPECIAQPALAGNEENNIAIGDAIQNNQLPASPVEAPVEAVKSLNTQRILREPPDQAALASSLFFAGEFELAYSLFKQLGEQTVTTDRSWNEYQTAACLRRLKQFSESQTALRTVAEQDGAELLGANARWWLEITDRKQQLQLEFDLFANVLGQGKESDDELTPPTSTTQATIR